ncbi:MAG: DUF1772 domain-containing protein [Gemmatimonadota bacterium]
MTAALVGAALFQSALTSGFLFAFAAVVMPGLRTLDDAAYLRAFQRIDGVIQEGQPLFILMWVGSLIAMLAALVVGVEALAGVDRLLLLGAGILYLVGVHLPTVAVNIPLNNRVQRLDVDALGPQEAREARGVFEGRWNRWNRLRTGLGAGSVLMMLLLLVRL